jgi:hypothetical protein
LLHGVEVSAEEARVAQQSAYGNASAQKERLLPENAESIDDLRFCLRGGNGYGFQK